MKGVVEALNRRGVELAPPGQLQRFRIDAMRDERDPRRHRVVLEKLREERRHADLRGFRGAFLVAVGMEELVRRQSSLHQTVHPGLAVEARRKLFVEGEL